MSQGSLSYCQIMVGQSMTGLVGLQELMEQMRAQGVDADDPELGARMVEVIRENNYIPARARADYEAALVREYRIFAGQNDPKRKPRPWRDPRKVHLNWYPVILDARCDGCGQCLEVCPNSVMGWNDDRSLMLVLEPYECAPGCQMCAKICPRRAIVMPPRESLHHLLNMRSS